MRLYRFSKICLNNKKDMKMNNRVLPKLYQTMRNRQGKISTMQFMRIF